MSPLSTVANVLKVTVLNNNAKVFVLLVSTWILVTILSSMDINVIDNNSPPPPMYYYTSLTNDHRIRKLQKTSSNKIEIDTHFLEEVDSAEGPDQDIFYDIKNDSEEAKGVSDNIKEEIDKGNPNPEYKFETAKKILYFTSYFGMHDWMFGFGNQPFLDHKCPVTNCYITNKRDNISLNQFDAILFHIRDMNDGGIHIPLPNRRKRMPNQRYVMFLMESPKNDGYNYEKLKNFFNWTMTFRLDSDFPNPYGWIEPIRRSYIAPPSQKDFPDLTFDISKAKQEETTLKFIQNLRRETSKKQKLVAWMVSNCGTHSQREHYVQELRKHIPVDIIGGCGKLKCKRTDGDKNHCIKNISKEYKFYLSFENSVCKDYVTEKFWSPLSFNNILPVVLGAGNYTKIAPTNSFIDALKFESPGKLAEYLLYLDESFEEYSNYFLWKTKFRVKSNNHNLAICKLCEALNDPQTPEKVYSDMEEWWKGDAKCKSKGDYPWSPKDTPFSFSGLLNDARESISGGAEQIFEKLRKSKVIV